MNPNKKIMPIYIYIYMLENFFMRIGNGTVYYY